MLHATKEPGVRVGSFAAVSLMAVLAFAATAAWADTHTKVCELRGGQAVPPIDTPARGCGRFTIDTDANTIEYYIVFSGLIGAETAAHFHGNAPPGMGAGVKIGLEAGNPKVGMVVYAEADEEALLGGNWYVNIHSSAHPSGEIRGQVVDFVADLDGFQENPAVPTDGGGWGVFNIDRCANTLDYYIALDGLDGVETAAHIHGFALQGTNAGVLHGLPAGSPKVGTWLYDEAQEQRILNGETYVNVHSSIAGGGEIRGQICNIIVPIDGTQEVPPTGSGEIGCGFLSINADTDQLGYFIRHSGMPTGETNAHIHGYAPPGVNAGVLAPLALGLLKKGVWDYPAGDEGMILDGLTYVNIHSDAHMGGEIRGQIEFPQAPCSGDVNCDGTVDVSDLLVMLDGWGRCDAPPVPCPTDLNGDGETDVTDLLDMLGQWGACP